MYELIEYSLFNFIYAVARSLPYRTAGRLGAFLGSIIFSLTPVRKKVTLDNLTKALPEKSFDEINVIARGAFRNYGIAVLESMWSSNKSPEELRPKVRITNPKVMINAAARKKGVIFLSAHYGSWELIPTSVRLHFDQPFVLLAQRQRNARIDAFFVEHRSRFGNSIVPMGVASRRILTALANGDIILMLGDQSGPKEAVFVDFFGRPSATHRGVAAFSLRTDASIVAGFLVREADGNYVLTFEEVDRSGLDGSSEQSVVELTQRHVAVLERWIRKHPDHWLWLHKRWKHTQYFEQHLTAEDKA